MMLFASLLLPCWSTIKKDVVGPLRHAADLKTTMRSQSPSGLETSTPPCKQEVPHRTLASWSGERSLIAIQDMIKDRSGCCFPAALHAAVTAGGDEMAGKAAQLSCDCGVCFETVHGFRDFCKRVRLNLLCNSPETWRWSSCVN